jgi:hypothetical protein
VAGQTVVPVSLRTAVTNRFALVFSSSVRLQRLGSPPKITQSQPSYLVNSSFLDETRIFWTKLSRRRSLRLARLSISVSRILKDSTGCPKNPRVLSGRLRRAKTFLRALDSAKAMLAAGSSGYVGLSKNTVCTVSSVRGDGPGLDDLRRHRPVSLRRSCLPDLAGPCPRSGQFSV